MKALVRSIPSSFGDCLTTHIEKKRPDLAKARQNWLHYCSALKECGCEVEVLEKADALPDSTFVEDTGVVAGSLFISSRMRAPERAPEAESVRAFFAETHEVETLEAPAFLDGGDVLRVGKKFFVGLSSRTNQEGFEQFRDLVKSQGFVAESVSVKQCLHLKTAVTALDEETLLLNPQWVEPSHFNGFRKLETEAEEPFAANVLAFGNTVLAAAGSPRRTELLQSLGYQVNEVDISELAKAEAGLTCLSIIWTPSTSN